MVKCVCCNAEIDVPKLDKQLKTMPCKRCEDVIQDCVDSFKEPKSRSTDEFDDEGEDMVAYLEDEDVPVLEMLL